MLLNTNSQLTYRVPISLKEQQKTEKCIQLYDPTKDKIKELTKKLWEENPRFDATLRKIKNSSSDATLRYSRIAFFLLPQTFLNELSMHWRWRAPADFVKKFANKAFTYIQNRANTNLHVFILSHVFGVLKKFVPVMQAIRGGLEKRTFSELEVATGCLKLDPYPFRGSTQQMYQEMIENDIFYNLYPFFYISENCEKQKVYKKTRKTLNLMRILSHNHNFFKLLSLRESHTAPSLPIYSTLPTLLAEKIIYLIALLILEEESYTPEAVFNKIRQDKFFKKSDKDKLKNMIEACISMGDMIFGWVWNIADSEYFQNTIVPQIKKSINENKAYGHEPIISLISEKLSKLPAMQDTIVGSWQILQTKMTCEKSALGYYKIWWYSTHLLDEKTNLTSMMHRAIEYEVIALITAENDKQVIEHKLKKIWTEKYFGYDLDEAHADRVIFEELTSHGAHVDSPENRDRSHTILALKESMDAIQI